MSRLAIDARRRTWTRGLEACLALLTSEDAVCAGAMVPLLTSVVASMSPIRPSREIAFGEERLCMKVEVIVSIVVEVLVPEIVRVLALVLHREKKCVGKLL